jgi:geranylgeranylglycerol-phosphate geranylgeranyltransferase
MLSKSLTGRRVLTKASDSLDKVKQKSNPYNNSKYLNNNFPARKGLRKRFKDRQSQSLFRLSYSFNNIAELIKVLIYYAKTRTPAVYCFAIATLMSSLLISFSLGIEIRPLTVGLVVVASYLLGLSTYIYNDLTDYDVDKINRIDNAIFTKQASTKHQLLSLILIIFSISLSITAIINIYSFAISITFTLLGILYSHPKFNLKNKFPLKTVVTAIGGGLLSLLGGVTVLVEESSFSLDQYYSHTSILSLLYLAFSFTIFYFIQSTMADIGDIKGDRAAGRRTFPIVLGMSRTLSVMLSVPITIFAIAILLRSYLDLKIVDLILISISCCVIITFIKWISRRLNDSIFIKNNRKNLRYINILTQISILLALI